MLEGREFGELVRHFYGRFFDKESLSPQGEPEASFSQVLGILAPPGAFVCLLTMILHPQGWDLVGLRFLFICYSMIAMGVVMVFEWDALFPDKRDYLVLTPLPLRTFTMFLAKLAALGVFLAVFLAAVNSCGVLLWPAVEARGNYFAVTGAHLLVLTSAGLFSALAVAGFRGALVTVFRGALYRRISVIAQTIAMAVLIMLLCLSPMMSASIRDLCRSHSPYLRWFPGFWFAGWYEQLRPAVMGRQAATGHVLAELGGTAIRSVWIAAAIFVVTFLPGYRSHTRRVLEAPEPRPKGPGPLARAFQASVNTLLRDPVECGVFHFIGQTIARSTKHRLFLATYGGLGAALVGAMLASGGNSRRVPLALSFILVSGLRAAFTFPSDLRANWAFQVSETSSSKACCRATRKWILIYAIVPLFAAMAALEAFHAPAMAVAYHFAFGVAISMLLMEALFLGFRKAPFTCSHFPGKVNLVFLGALFIFGFTICVHYVPMLEDWLWAVPVAAVGFFLLLGGSFFALMRAHELLLVGETGLEYEDDGDPDVVRLGLTE